MLSLAKIKQGHYSCLFVLRWISLQDFGDELLIDAVEFERDVGIVVGGVAVLRGGAKVSIQVMIAKEIGKQEDIGTKWVLRLEGHRRRGWEWSSRSGIWEI